MRRSTKVGITLASLLAGGGLVYANGREHYDYNQVCADQQTQQRVADANCESSSNGYTSTGMPYHWYYVPTNQGGYVPGVGQAIPNGTGSYAVPPTGTVAKGAVSSTGGKVVSRGGFGGKSGSVGG